MKYCLDINSKEVLEFIDKELENKGYFIVCLNEFEFLNKNKSIKKKSLIVNIIGIDFYFIIEFKNNIEKYEIYYSNFERSIKLSEKIKYILNNENIIYENGEKFYLVKNINAPTIYIRIPIKYKKDFIKKYMVLIKESLINII